MFFVKYFTFATTNKYENRIENNNCFYIIRNWGPRLHQQP